ncbi:MAG: RdgB/HAM1 family non-canonical purine NTP pyrophosphatase [Muribaculaceae bacterium]|nr:RdgB/HAM1 family non-canonical purine NTP pyrophosphatase [Muribaculaceae bacterium]
MKKIVFASNNSHKLAELRSILGHRYEVLSLADINCHDDIPETADSFEGNSLLKARWVKDRYGYDCFADDSGLEVYALGGAPGIYSARYSGATTDVAAANNAKLLRELSGADDRRARFRTAIALLTGDAEPVFFNGTVEGHILEAPRGRGGFGYDPLFVPEGWTRTFAEATGEEKNAISHRGRAVAALAEYLDNNFND